jgi:uncharacterized protein
MERPNPMIRFFRSLAALTALVAYAAVPALAAEPIQDGAGLFSAQTVSQLDQTIGNFTAQTGKQIVVVTVPSLNGSTIGDAAQSVFQSQNVNGIVIFIAKTEREDLFLPGPKTAQFFPKATLDSIRASMESQFKDGDYDGGITTAVDGILNVFRAHLNSAPAAGGQRSYPVASNSSVRTQHQGVHFSMFWLILLIVVGFLIVRSIFRAMAGPRYYGGPGVPPGAGGPGYGPGPYGGGYGGPGYYGGGGSFWSGLLGGLGGAWLGNEMFGGNRGTTIIDNNAGGMMPVDQSGGSWGGGDAGGWGSDAGQADMGASSGGDFSGGGFGGDFGGGDFGGGGGFGDGGSGGGW